ncbi:hypothetical protein AMTRI_Chr07g82330 [Amborella trichopoda]
MAFFWFLGFQIEGKNWRRQRCHASVDCEFLEYDWRRERCHASVDCEFLEYGECRGCLKASNTSRPFKHWIFHRHTMSLWSGCAMKNITKWSTSRSFKFDRRPLKDGRLPLPRMLHVRSGMRAAPHKLIPCKMQRWQLP